jgi:hypothetical protein
MKCSQPDVECIPRLAIGRVLLSFKNQFLDPDELLVLWGERSDLFGFKLGDAFEDAPDVFWLGGWKRRCAL